jgi:hypothetical protein
MARVDDLIGRLEGVRPRGDGRWMARCPAHSDRTASLSIRADGDRILLHCFAGCDPDAVTGAVGMELRDLMPERHDHAATRWYIPAADALRIVGREMMIVSIIADDIRERRDLSEGTWQRLATAVSRINEIRRFVRD